MATLGELKKQSILEARIEEADGAAMTRCVLLDHLESKNSRRGCNPQS
jgi:hypothetical protein